MLRSVRPLFGYLLLFLPAAIVCESHIRNKIEPTMSVIALPFILLLTVPVRMLLYRYNLMIPPQIFWIAHALIYGGLLVIARKKRSYKAYMDLDWTLLAQPRWLIVVYFPAICFRTAYKMDLHILRRSWFQIFFLAVIANIISAVILGVLMKLIMNTRWSWSMAVLFGTTCTFTEAVDFTAMAKRMDKYKHLITVMEGECLLGIGIGSIIIDVTIALSQSILVTWYHVVIVLIRMVGLAVIIGMGMGFLGKVCILWLHHDKLSVLGVTFTISFLSVYLATVSGAGGTLACVIVCLKVANERARYGNEVDQLLNIFWDTLVYIIRPYFFVSVLGICFERLYDVGSHNSVTLVTIIVSYFMATVSRIISILLVTPIVSRTGYGVDFKSLVLITWAPQKSLVCLMVALSVFHDLRLQEMANETIAGVTTLFVFTLLFNCTSVPLIIKYLGFSELSMMKRTNMANCMKYIMEKRRHVISMLKMNRFLSDANWPLVHDITWLKHPYKHKDDDSDENVDEDFLGDSRASYCPECDLVVQIDPSPKEYVEMTKEARLRVLKSEKISYIRQYEKGLLSQEGIRTLLQAVEVALDSPDLIIKLDDYFKIIKKRNFYDVLKKCLTRITRKVVDNRRGRIPKTKFKRKCFYISNNSYFTILYVFMIVMQCLFVGLFEALKEKWLPYKKAVLFSSNGLMVTFEIYYGLKILIKIFALSYVNFGRGFITFISDAVNFFEFLSFLTRSICVITMLHYFITNQELSWFSVQNVYFYIAIMKLVHILTTILYLTPKIIKFCERNRDIRIAYAYEIGHCLVTGYAEVSEMLSQMVRNKKIRDAIHRQLEEDRLKITKELGLMHKFSPWIAVSTKTRQAVKATLNHLTQTVLELKTSGFVDMYEFSKLQDSIEDRMRILRNLKDVELSSPKSLFKELQWLQNEVIAEYLYDNSSTRVWDAGDTICKEGEISEGVFVLVTGLFKLSYEPDPHFLTVLKETGHLPVIDYMTSSNYTESMQDYIFAGNSIGELCALTARPYNCSIVAEVPSQAFVLNHRTLALAIKHDRDPLNGLECRLWKYVAINIGVSLLQDTLAYQSYTQDQIRLLLETSFIPNLESYKTVILSDQVHDVMLIDGIVYDQVTLDQYVAPCYISRTVTRLIVNRHKTLGKPVKLMILPAKDSDEYELMDKLEDLAELESNVSESNIINSQRYMEKRTQKLYAKRRSSLMKKIQRNLATRTADHYDVEDEDGAAIISSRRRDNVALISDSDLSEPSQTQDLVHVRSNPLHASISRSKLDRSAISVKVDPDDEGYSRAHASHLKKLSSFTIGRTGTRSQLGGLQVMNAKSESKLAVKSDESTDDREQVKRNKQKKDTTD